MDLHKFLIRAGLAFSFLLLVSAWDGFAKEGLHSANVDRLYQSAKLKHKITKNRFYLKTLSRKHGKGITMAISEKGRVYIIKSGKQINIARIK